MTARSRLFDARRRSRRRSPVRRGLNRLTAKHPRRVLVAEFLMVLVITTVAEFSDKKSPKPSSYMAQMIVFLILGFAAELGDQSARVAQALGGLVLLTTAMMNAPAILDALAIVAGQEQRDKQKSEKGKGKKKRKDRNGLRDLVPGGKRRRARDDEPKRATQESTIYAY